MLNRLKNLVLGKPRCVIKNVIFEGIEYRVSMEIAERFNEYFINSIRDIYMSIENVHFENVQIMYKLQTIELIFVLYL